MPAPALSLRVALLPLVLLVACRTRDNPDVCTTMKEGDCRQGYVCNMATQRCEKAGGTDVGRGDGATDGPGASETRAETGTEAPVADAGPDAPPQCRAHGDCTEPNRPACVEGACVPCQGAQAACQAKPATPFCGDKGACVACNNSRDCSEPTAPICGADNKCTRCIADSQCKDRDGDDPGLCLAHLDGRCAKEDEVIHVRATRPGCVDAPTSGGTLAMPYCRPQDALADVTPTRRVLLLRGQDPFAPLRIPREFAGIAGGVISVIGQPGAVILPGAEVGVEVAAGDIFLRGLTIDGGAKEGVVADGEATVLIYQSVIKGNKLGGLRVTGGAGFDVVNTIFDANGPGLVEGALPFGGAYLGAPTGGRRSVFRFNTVIRNLEVGVVCPVAAQQELSSVLLADNRSDDQRRCVMLPNSRVGGNPMFDMTRPYELTAASPCKDVGDAASHPPDDWKGDPRPSGPAPDCGAVELQQD